MSQLSVSWQSVGRRVCVRQCGTFSIMYKVYILQVWGLPHLTSWTSLANILITLNQPVQTSIDGLVPIVVSLTIYYAFKNKCHQKCSAFRSSWLIGWENIWVTKPSLLRHRKVLLQRYAGEKDNKCKQLIVAFKVLRNKRLAALFSVGLFGW